MEELSRSARLAFVVLTALNALVLVAALAGLLTERFGVSGYVLAVIAAPLASPAILVLPWFDAWARGALVSSRVLSLWLLWVACLLPLVCMFVAEKRRVRSQALERNPAADTRPNGSR